MRIGIASTLLAAAIGLPLAGCQQDVSEAVTSDASTTGSALEEAAAPDAAEGETPAGEDAANPAQKTARGASGETAAGERRSPGKPSVPIRIDYEYLTEAKVGEPLEIALDVRSSLVGPMQLRVAPRDGLAIGKNQAEAVSLDKSGDSDTLRRTVTVVPQAEGRSYLTVYVSADTAAGPQMKVISIPVQVGDKPPALETNGELIETADGETIVSMPAEENDGG